MFFIYKKTYNGIIHTFNRLIKNNDFVTAKTVLIVGLPV